MANKLSSPQIEEIKQMAADHFWPHMRPTGDMSAETGLKLVQSAKGVWVEDVEGVQWFDTLAGMWLKNIGHGRKEMAEAVYAQMMDISYSPGGTVTPVTARLAAKIAGLAPDKASLVFFVSGGSEAVETALKLAKNYHKNRGEAARWKVISRRGSYHGATHACMSLGGGGPSAAHNYGPLMPGNIHIAQPDAYRGIFGNGLEAAKDLERAIEHEGPGTVAAFIGEPISVAAGLHIPDPDYWPAVREICDKYGVLLIFDEVITGFGRTGKMLGCEHWQVQPDIFTIAKGLTSGYLPIGAAVASKKVVDAFGSDEAAFRHIITFGGNPPSCAAGLTNLQIIEAEGLVENSANMGQYLYEQLQNLYEHDLVGDVRGGLGLLCAVELVKDRDTKEKFPKELKLADYIARYMRENRLLGRAADILFVAPPLCVSRAEIDYIVQALDDIIRKLERDLR